jgi:hypothetical protein
MQAFLELSGKRTILRGMAAADFVGFYQFLVYHNSNKAIFCCTKEQKLGKKTVGGASIEGGRGIF